MPPPIPPQPTPQPPPVPGSTRQISTHPLKTVGCVGSIVAIGIVAIWFVYNSSKPTLFAKVEVTSTAVRITNGNDTAWDSPTIILNDGFAGLFLISPALGLRMRPASFRLVISRVDSTTSDSSPVMKKSVRLSLRLADFGLEPMKHGNPTGRDDQFTTRLRSPPAQRQARV